ncbi:MAG: hypothetical protein ACTSR3_02980 [Candidatus Helarchaeota archaeon]
MSFDEKEVEKAKAVALAHYKLIQENNKEEWMNTIKKISQKNAERYWWPTGRKRIEQQGMSYTFKFFDERYSTPKRLKFFFNRLDKDGKPSGTGQVPVILVKDENGEWKVDVASW